MVRQAMVAADIQVGSREVQGDLDGRDPGGVGLQGEGEEVEEERQLLDVHALLVGYRLDARLGLRLVQPVPGHL